MILGIGTDLCKISRVRKAIQSDHFVKKVFSQEEIDYAVSQGDPARHFASAYAAKEALAKASGLGMFALGLDASWIRRTENGPAIICKPHLAETFAQRGIRNFWVSLSHEDDFALAVVVLES